MFNTNLKYTRLQNQTKELFFKCLDEGRSLEYFKSKLEELWGRVDYSYTKEEIAAHITAYTKSKSEVNRNGLKKRREAEKIMFEEGI